MNPKFLLGGALLAMAVILVIAGGFAGGAQYFLTIGDLRAKGAEFQDQNVRISGAVIGDSIRTYVAGQTPIVEFDIVDAVEKDGVFQRVAGQAPLHIVYEGPRPELLQNDAQAIMEGRLSADGKFYADTLLLKCPTRYEEQFPEHTQGN